MSVLATFRNVVYLERPGPPELDPAGGYTETWTPLNPAAWHCSIRQASPGDVERIGGGTITTTTALVLRGRYHAELLAAGPAARARFEGGRVLEIASVHDREERGIELEALARETTGRAVTPAPTGPVDAEPSQVRRDRNLERGAPQPPGEPPGRRDEHRSGSR